MFVHAVIIFRVTYGCHMFITRERDFSHVSVVRKENLAEKEVRKEDMQIVTIL